MMNMIVMATLGVDEDWFDMGSMPLVPAEFMDMDMAVEMALDRLDMQDAPSTNMADALTDMPRYEKVLMQDMAHMATSNEVHMVVQGS
jgi:hypothetical protein